MWRMSLALPLWSLRCTKQTFNQLLSVTLSVQLKLPFYSFSLVLLWHFSLNTFNLCLDHLALSLLLSGKKKKNTGSGCPPINISPCHVAYLTFLLFERPWWGLRSSKSINHCCTTPTNVLCEFLLVGVFHIFRRILWIEWLEFKSLMLFPTCFWIWAHYWFEEDSGLCPQISSGNYRSQVMRIYPASKNTHCLVLCFLSGDWGQREEERN